MLPHSEKKAAGMFREIGVVDMWALCDSPRIGKTRHGHRPPLLETLVDAARF
jgi:hypothetical protein